MVTLSRRNFLKLGASALLGLAFKPLPPDDQPLIELGRVTIEYLRVRQRPTPQAKQVGWKVCATAFITAVPFGCAGWSATPTATSG